MINITEYNISIPLANYMLMAMNPASSTLYNFVSETIYGSSQKENLRNLTKELDYKMKENSIEQLSDLYKKLAIRYVLCRD